MNYGGGGYVNHTIYRIKVVMAMDSNNKEDITMIPIMGEVEVISLATTNTGTNKIRAIITRRMTPAVPVEIAVLAWELSAVSAASQTASFDLWHYLNYVY